MIKMADRYFVYDVRILTQSVKQITCKLCGKTKKPQGRRIDARGWVAYHIANRTKERYCPDCAAKVWPFAYADAMKQIEGEACHQPGDPG